MALPTGYFNANVPDSDPTSYAQLMLRVKLMQELEDRKKNKIENIGQGIYSAAGDIADDMRMRQLMEAIQRQAKYESAQPTGRPPSGLPQARPPGSTLDRPVLGTSPEAARAEAAPETVAAPFSGYGMGMGALGLDPDTMPPGSRDDIASVLAQRYPGPSFNEASDSAAAPMPTEPAANVPLPPPRPVYNRNPQLAEMEADPTLKPRMLALMRGESPDPREQQAVAEEIFNQSAARNQPLARTMLDTRTDPRRGYFPPQSLQRGQASEDVLTPVLRGSNMAGEALGFAPTGNASGGVAARGIENGRYSAAGRLPGGAETFVQARPDNIARLEATRVPANAQDAITEVLTPRPRAYAALDNPAIVSDIPSSDLTQLAQYYKPPTTTFPGGAAISPAGSPSSQAQPPSLLEHPGPEPTRPPWSQDQMQAWQTMNNPALDPKGAKVEQAKRVFELHEKEREADFTRRHASWQTRSDNYWKDTLDQAQKQLDIELKRGTNQPAIQEQWLKVFQAQRNLAKPETDTIRGTVFERPYNPVTGTFGPAKVGAGFPPPEEEKRSETQAKADLFISRVMPDLNKVEHQYQHGRALTGILPNLTQAPMVPGWVGKMVLPEEYKVVNDALGNWAGAFLQQVSGQAVTPSEAMRNLPSMIPQLNDTDQQLADKSRRRRDFTMGAALGSGDQGKKMIMDANASYLPVVPFTNREEMMKLPVGQRISFPDGTIRQVPWHL